MTMLHAVAYTAMAAMLLALLIIAHNVSVQLDTLIVIANETRDAQTCATWPTDPACNLK